MGSYQEPSYGPVSYSYDWAVKDDYSGNNYGQTESRNDKSTVGSYYVLLPDGRTQKVSYTVDAYGGYVAEVTYEARPNIRKLQNTNQLRPINQPPPQPTNQPQPQHTNQHHPQHQHTNQLHLQHQHTNQPPLPHTNQLQPINQPPP